jgi:hypothetical protein
MFKNLPIGILTRTWGGSAIGGNVVVLELTHSFLIITTILLKKQNIIINIKNQIKTSR